MTINADRNISHRSMALPELRPAPERSAEAEPGSPGSVRKHPPKRKFPLTNEACDLCRTRKARVSVPQPKLLSFLDFANWRGSCECMPVIMGQKPNQGSVADNWHISAVDHRNARVAPAATSHVPSNIMKARSR